MSMRVIIIEDSEIDVENLSILLEGSEDCNLVGVAANIDDGLLLANTEHPDLIFLDIQLGNVNSLDYIDKFENDPMIICTTLHETHALNAFGIGAVGYIMKPVTRSSLDQAVGRVCKLRSGSDAVENETVLLKTGTTRRVVPFSDIILIKADRDYTLVIDADAKSTICNQKMRDWIDLLPGNSFVQLDRSNIINLRWIRDYRKHSHDNKATICFKNDYEIEIGSVAFKRLNDVFAE